MQEWIQRIAVYVVLITVLRSLIGKPQYQQYFRFVSGLILILIIVSPVLHLFGGQSDIYGMLNRYLYQLDQEEIETSLQVAEGELQTLIENEYRQYIESQITQLAQQQELDIQEISVSFDSESKVIKLEIHINSETKTPAKSALHEFRQEIEQYYQLGEESVVIWI